VAAQRKDRYVTSSGIELKLVPVRDILVEKYVEKARREFIAQGKQVDPPAYTITTATGEVEGPFPFTEETLDDPQDPIQTRINHAKWQQYIAAREELEAELNEKRFVAWIMLGVDCEVPDDGWEDKYELFGVEVPDNPLERKAFWLIYEVLDQYDRGMIVPALQLLSAGRLITQEQIDFFRENAGRAIERESAALFEDALSSLREMGSESKIHGIENGEGMGNQDAVGMGQFVGRRQSRNVGNGERTGSDAGVGNSEPISEETEG